MCKERTTKEEQEAYVWIEQVRAQEQFNEEQYKLMTLQEGNYAR